MRLCKKISPFIKAFVPVLILLLMVIWNPLYTFDALLCDGLYAQLDGTSRNIKIISVEEETLDAYGNFGVWSREKTAQLIDLLYAEETNAPAIVALDFLFTGDTDTQTDAMLKEACEGNRNIITASNVVYRGTTKQSKDGKLYYDIWNIEMVEEPYAGLAEVTQSGYTNAYIATDGCVRYTKLTEQYEGNTLPSFAWLTYELFEEINGREAIVPETNEDGQLTFFYSGQVGEFTHYSMKQVLEGKIPASEFKDCIVLVGAYAPGFQDAYVAATERGNPMYGVEIQANMIQALQDGKTAVNFPTWIYLVVTTVILYLFFLFAQKQKLFPVFFEAGALIAIHLLVGKYLAHLGYTITQFYFVGIIVACTLYFVIEKYVLERIRRRKMLSTFKQYVDAKVVDVLAKDDQFKTRLGGEKRNVAVLFVDIRGFTPLSESLMPEQVVKILNEYLALTTSCILGNNGMLDKFIGDATMAVFNAPHDLDDYVYRAVLTALDMRAGAEKLAKNLKEQYGKTVSFGIGVNCGDAVVGNIGCDFRMDYTAIGDTVNTAARLESRAKAGEILISEAVYECLKDRIVAEAVGEMELKGKSKPLMVYQVIGKKEG